MVVLARVGALNGVAHVFEWPLEIGEGFTKFFQCDRERAEQRLVDVTPMTFAADDKIR